MYGTNEEIAASFLKMVREDVIATVRWISILQDFLSGTEDTLTVDDQNLTKGFDRIIFDRTAAWMKLEVLQKEQEYRQVNIIEMEDKRRSLYFLKSEVGLLNLLQDQYLASPDLKPQKGEPMTDLTEETKTLATILRHRILVQKYLLKLARELETRALVHDLSKLQLDELGGFVEIQRVAREHKFGSPEYKASIKSEAVALHLSRNSHHPEFHHDGIKDMGLLDLVEMVVDWAAASETYGQTSFGESLRVQKERYGITDEQFRFIQLIAEEIMKK